MKNATSFPLTALVSTLGFVLAPPVHAKNIKEISRSAERRLLGPHYEGRLVPVETDLSQGSKELADAEPLIFVHGMSGSAQNFAQLVPAVSKFSQYQLFYFAYDDLHRSLKRSALELAVSLRQLRAPRITVIAHSMGGLVTREALNLLAQTHPAELLPEIHVIAIDSPWHGGSSKNCDLKGSRIDNFIELFLPAAVADMRTCSDFLKNLYATKLPGKLSTTLFFAEEGDQAWDYSEGPIKGLPQKIADYISTGKAVTGTLAELYFWDALRSSSQYSYFEVSLHTLQKETPLSAALVTKELQTYFPRLPGDHTSVLASHPKRKMDLPKYLEQIL
ncbi:esterase/lipase family protein [Bdellovibrio svalbardensis]|uniref:Alpha/beta hydrolase n=1 Tax=Bdellovibrio svalbardensis TaxID=2972972 RepID=A0ABT6DJ72_9BACT|nr:alpha/beta hydrolase [Bdellovibrio svalbardensis]MDG0816885.1 alpha/beta hydrolase [Bdellovibrio svalbardensis]